jgi:hypothetical protein
MTHSIGPKFSQPLYTPPRPLRPRHSTPARSNRRHRRLSTPAAAPRCISPPGQEQCPSAWRCSLITHVSSIPTLGALHCRLRRWVPGCACDVAGSRGTCWCSRRGRGRRSGGGEGLHRRRLQPRGEQRLVGNLRPCRLRRPERRHPLLSLGAPSPPCFYLPAV